MRIKLTSHGKIMINNFIKDLKEKRKDILDAHKDVAYDFPLPTAEDIINDMETDNDIVDNGYYINSWACTKHYDLPIALDYMYDYYYAE